MLLAAVTLMVALTDVAQHRTVFQQYSKAIGKETSPHGESMLPKASCHVPCLVSLALLHMTAHHKHRSEGQPARGYAASIRAPGLPPYATHRDIKCKNANITDKTV